MDKEGADLDVERLGGYRMTRAAKRNGEAKAE